MAHSRWRHCGIVTLGGGITSLTGDLAEVTLTLAGRAFRCARSVEGWGRMVVDTDEVDWKVWKASEEA